MLYDNALLARAYALAHRRHRLARPPPGRRGDPRLPAARDAAAGRRLRRGPGRRLAGRRGRLLRVDARRSWPSCCRRPQARAVTLRYGVTPEGNFEGQSILHVAAPLDASRASSARTPGRCWRSAARDALRRARASGPAPARDDKVVAAWNGLAVAALADAGRDRSGARTTWTPPSTTAAFLLDALVVDGRLRRVPPGGAGPPTSASSTTTPTSATACCACTRRPSSPRWLAAARDLADRMVELFADPDGAGFFYAGSRRRGARGPHARGRGPPHARRATPRPRTCCCAWPTSPATPGLEERAARRAAAGARPTWPASRRRSAPRWSRSTTTWPTAARSRSSGARDDPRTAALVAAAREAARPLRRPRRRRPGRPRGRRRRAAARRPARWSDGAPAAYVCRRFACQAPVVTAQELTAALSPVAFRAGQPMEGARVSASGDQARGAGADGDGGGGCGRAGGARDGGEQAGRRCGR